MNAFRKALFLDRDGTLIRDEGYLHQPQKVALLPGVKEALAAFKNAHYALFLFSNQSGVGRGYYTLHDAEVCNERMLELLALGKDLFTDICLATELPTDFPVYRKPSPRFILESVESHSLDKTQCWMVGDKLSDVKAGFNSGIHSVFISQDDNFSTELLKELRLCKAQTFLSLLEFSRSVL